MAEERGQPSRVGEEPLGNVGECLRTSFSADNHDSLGRDITRLLLLLSHDPKRRPDGRAGAEDDQPREDQLPVEQPSASGRDHAGLGRWVPFSLKLPWGR